MMKLVPPALRVLPVVAALACALALPHARPSSARQTEARGFGVVHIKVEDGREVKLYDKSFALVVGVSDYTAGWPRLPGVKRDIEEVARALELHGFQVTKVENPDSAQLDKAFKTFIDEHGLGVENRLLFYFAGHGHTIKQSYGEEMGYIVPVDAPNPNRDRAGFMSKAMDMQQMELYARRVQAKHALFVFDSCFSGALFALSRAVPDSISYKTARPVRQFITSGSADEQVPDQSIFRRQFVEALEGEADSNRDGYVTGTELGEFLQDRVVNYSRNAQHPQYGKIRNPNLDKGDFVLALPEAAGAQARQNLAAAEAGLAQVRQAAVSAQTNVDREQANLNIAQRGLKRVADLVESGVVSRAEYDAASERFKQTQAALRTAQAQLASANTAVREAEARVNQQRAAASSPPNVQPTPAVVDPAVFELAFWDTIKNSTDPEDFKAYLDKYPDGQFSVIAKKRASLQPAQPAGDEKAPPRADPIKPLSVSVYFKAGNAALSSEAKQTIADFLRAAQAMPSFTIEVTGVTVTDVNVDAEVNSRLAQRRADSVIEYLSKNLKVPPARIRNMSVAPSPLDNSTREGRVANRRVDLKVVAQ